MMRSTRAAIVPPASPAAERRRVMRASVLRAAAGPSAAAVQQAADGAGRGSMQALALAGWACAATAVAVLLAWQVSIWLEPVAPVSKRTATLGWPEPPQPAGVAPRQPDPAAPLQATAVVRGGWLDPGLGMAVPATAAMPAPGAAAEVAVPHAGIDPRQLGSQQLLLARSFVREVGLRPLGRGGFEVMSVAEGSDFARLGLQAGDIVHTLDIDGRATVDEGSMIELTRRHRLEIDIQRAGRPLRLSLALDRPDATQEERSHGP